MNSLILFLILVTLVGIGLVLRKIQEQLKRANDFSAEDAQVRAMTEQIKKAEGRLPKQHKGEIKSCQ